MTAARFHKTMRQAHRCRFWRKRQQPGAPPARRTPTLPCSTECSSSVAGGYPVNSLALPLEHQLEPRRVCRHLECGDFGADVQDVRNVQLTEMLESVVSVPDAGQHLFFPLPGNLEVALFAIEGRHAPVKDEHFLHARAAVHIPEAFQERYTIMPPPLRENSCEKG